MSGIDNPEYSKQEREKKLKKQKVFERINGILILFLCFIAILDTNRNGISFNSFFPLGLLPMQWVIFNEIKKLKKQIAAKN